MARSNTTIVSIALMIIGTGLGIWAYLKAGSVGSKLTSAISWAPSDNVMMLYIGGAACFAVGAWLFFKKR